MRLSRLQEIIGVKFNRASLLEQALVHDSYVNENPDFAPSSNERLEFLGDAVLGLVVTEKLYHDFPGYSEGKMTHLRAGLVRRDTLARMAATIGLGDYLYLGRGEEGSGGRSKIPNLAGAMEALIGAVFLDKGINEAKECALRLLDPEYQRIIETGTAPDYKSQLQELIQSKKQRAPEYKLMRASGPDHARWFVVEVSVDQRALGKGEGKSKKTAESEAARDALERLAKSV